MFSSTFIYFEKTMCIPVVMERLKKTSSKSYKDIYEI